MSEHPLTPSNQHSDEAIAAILERLAPNGLDVADTLSALTERQDARRRVDAALAGLLTGAENTDSNEKEV